MADAGIAQSADDADAALVGEDHGRSQEGIERGEDLSPEELGVKEVIAIPLSYVAEVSFEDMGLPPALHQGVTARGYVKPTPVQAAAYARAVEGIDLIVRSRTGTGKTAAFMLPTLTRLADQRGKTRALILAPTRELAIQVADEASQLARFLDLNVLAVYGGVGLGPQAQQLKDGAEIVVGTPGRLLDHIRRGNLKLSDCQIAVLDEADEMLSMGFLEEVRNILKHLPANHQTLLFSATIDASVAGLIKRFMTDPQEIMLSGDQRTVDGIKNIIYDASDSYPKARSLLYMLYLENPESAIIFCNTRDDCSFVTAYLNRQGFDSEYINSDLPQRERERVMNRIKRGELSFLVATDIAARGIDISDLTHVINYSLPEDPDLYVHRVGRTGRIGKLGTALSLVSGRDLSAELALRNKLKIPFERRTLPSVDEASRLWTERHLIPLRKAASMTAYEAYLPMAKEMVKTLGEDERNRLFATALRVFFAWHKTMLRQAEEEEAEGASGDEQDGQARPEERQSRDERRPRRDGGRDGRRDGGRDGRRDGGRDGRRDERGRGERSGERRQEDARPRPEAAVPVSGEGTVSRPEPRAEERREGRGGESPRSEGPRGEERREGRRGDERRGDRRRGDERREGPRNEGPRTDGARAESPRGEGRRGRDDRRERGPAREELGAVAEQNQVGTQTPTRPAERPAPAPELDLLDPLAAFAAANDIDLDALIDGEEDDVEEDALAPGEEGQGGAEGAAERRRRRGGRRRRRGRRGGRPQGGGEGGGEGGPRSAPPATGE